MPRQADLQRLTLGGIAHRCRHETELFLQRQGYDPRYCFELFRRAIFDRSQRAWEHIYGVYRPLVTGWAERHSALAASGEEAQYFVNRAFEKMWAALTPAKFERFPDLKSLLRYLQMCVHSVILDQVRSAERSRLDARAEDLARQSAPQLAVEDQALARLHGEELWSEISARLRDERERRVVYCSFVLALTPREICAQFPGAFDDVREVYRIKENVLARLRRDAELRKSLGYDA